MAAPISSNWKSKAPRTHRGFILRLYDPQAHQWSLNFANSSGGTIGPPAVGQFKMGRGEFYDTESSGPHGRTILVRFVISDITPNSCHFEQAYSDDGGATWETNWIATDVRSNLATARSNPCDYHLLTVAHSQPPSLHSSAVSSV